MKRTQLEELLLLKALQFKHTQSNCDLIDIFSESEAVANSTKNVCAKVSIPLADRLDSVCSLLSISKRLFVETAIIEALNKAAEIIEETELGLDQDSDVTVRMV